MNAVDAKDFMLGVFKTVWDAYPGVPAVEYTDLPGAPPTVDKLWARVTVKHATGAQTSLGGVGSRRFTATGFVWVQVFAPAGDGSTGALTAAQAIVNAYRTARDTNVWFRNVMLVDMGGDGAFSRVDVKANFQYDDVR